MANKQDTIDISSIIENKILTKKFWQEKMLDDEKMNNNARLLISSNRGDKKAIKLSSDGESEQSLDSSLTQDSSIDIKLIQPDYVTVSETKGVFVKRSIDEKVDQQSDTEEELYSDCLEQFVDDHCDRIHHLPVEIRKNNETKLSDNQCDVSNNCMTINSTIDTLNNKTIDYSNDRTTIVESDDQVNGGGNELSVIKEEEDSMESRSINFEKSSAHRTDDQMNIERTDANLRVKVDGSNAQVDCMISRNSETTNVQVNNELNRAEQRQEQVIIKENIVEQPSEQGDQVTQSTICSTVFTDRVVEKSNRIDSLKCLKANSSPEKCSQINDVKRTVQSTNVLLAKSIKSESPSIHFEQRVSVVKSTFESLQLIMNSSTPALDIHKGETVIKHPLKCLKRIEDNERINETESKIAREIRELKEREEELKQMRIERLNKENLLNCSIGCLNNCTTNCTKNYLSSANSTASSADSTISLNRSDKSSERSDSPPVSNDQCVSSIDSLDEGFGEYKSPNLTSKIPNQSNEIHTTKSNPGEIQKILATTRIQQEIEEQTKRELALKAVGSIKTISQERTDKYSMSSNLLLSNLSANVLSPTLSLSSLASSLSSLNMTNNSQSNSINQTTGDSTISPATTYSITVNKSISPKSTTATTPTSTNTTTTTTDQQSITCLSSTKVTRTNLYTKNTSIKHRTFSTSHLNNLTNNSSTSPFNLFKMNQTGRHISMHKFIATKGKSASSNQFNNTNNVGHTELSHSYSDLLRPPKIDPIRAHKIIEKKCLQSADYKISSELRDLYQREEELRKQRARTIGQSQPNLSLLDSDEGITSGHKSNDKEQSIDKDQNQVLQKFSLEGCRARPLASLLKKATSNPNLTEAQLSNLSTGDHQMNEQSSKSACKEVNLCSSSSRLIAQWENKIEILKTEKIK